MAYYAWADIRFTHRTGEGDDLKEDHITITRGSKIDKARLKGLKDSEWQAMIDSKAIRNRPFPAPKDYSGSAIDYLRDQLAESRAVSPVDEEEAASELADVTAMG